MRGILSLLVLLTLPLGACSVSDSGSGPLYADFGEDLAEEYRQILFQATSLELVAIDPDWPTEESRADTSTLHGYNVRGRKTITDRAKRLELLTSLADGARENTTMAAACFNPRHALIAEHGGKVCEVIICFECLTFQVWDGTKRVDSVLVSESPRPTFDRIFGAEGLSIAPRGH
ncbi:MAG: hypothetical protein ACPG31_05415 [Planctomycetota bacterium]